MKVTEKFGLISCLKLNVAKSVFLKIGSLKHNEEDIVPDKNYQCTKDPVKFLGIMISVNKNELFKLNFETQLIKLKTVLDIWSQRDLTPIGKLTILRLSETCNQVESCTKHSRPNSLNEKRP